MPRSSSTSLLRRYTNLAATINILQERQLTLLSPETWDDKNDRHFMKIYKGCKSLKTLTAICLAGDNADTYHHWRVFSPNADGVCIVFRKDQLLAAFEGKPGVRKKGVSYQKIEALPHLNPSVADLPFIKRMPYQPEGEYRIVYESETETAEFRKFDIPLDAIEAIILSPWLHTSLVSSVTKTLKAIDGCENIRMYGSTVVENEQWKSVADGVSARHKPADGDV